MKRQSRSLRTEACWRERVQAWRDSGQTPEDFVVGKDFAASTLRVWIGRLRRRAPPGFVQLVPKIAAHGEGTSTHPPSGPCTSDLVVEVGPVRVRVPRGFDPTLFRVHKNRSKEAAQALMGADFAGVAITDRYGAYLWLDPEQRQVCWAHLDRDFEAMVDRGGRSAEVGLALQRESDRMFKWWAWVQQGHRDRAWLVRKLPELKRAVGAALEAGSGCGHDKTAGVCQEILGVFPALWTFGTVEGVEPTNNRAEQDLRPAVQMRKLSFGTDSARGSCFFERIMTVVMTLRRQKRALLDWVAEAYEAFRLRRTQPSLLPQPP
jgi:hypothetical protein